MKARPLPEPRSFLVGVGKHIRISQSHEIELELDEQVLLSANDKLHAVTRKEWGFYLTESLEPRVSEAGFRAGMVSNSAGRRYLVLILSDQLEAFENYREQEGLSVTWI